jgi:undecaprenyl-diphosphatase
VSVAHAIILALLQGAFELFPVSSLGHTVIVPALLGWHEKQSDPSFLAFVVVLHLGTAVALLTFFWRDWVRIVRAVLHSVVSRRLSDDPDERLGWLIVAGSIPAGVLGLSLKGPLNNLFGVPALAALFLAANGVVLIAGERLRRVAIAEAVSAGGQQTAVAGTEMRVRLRLRDLSFAQAFGIGGAQALALLPGFSRSGASMVGGLLAKLDHVDAARFSFLLATPLIFAAGLLEVSELFAKNAQVGPGLAALGFVISGVTAYLAVRFLMRYFESERLDVFGYYCLAFGGFALVVLGLRAAF